MRNLLFFAFGLLLLATSCSKELNVVDNPPVITAADTVLMTGGFTGVAHPTSGKVQLVLRENNKLSLVFENFTTDSGPDLRVYLSADKNATDFTEVSTEVNNGSYELEVPAGTDTDKKRLVLIWCKQFSVLFGIAELN